MPQKHKFSFTVFMLVMIFFYIPLLMLVIYSFNSGKSMVWQGFSLTWYKELFFNSRDELWSSFWNSLLIGMTSSVLATLIATLGGIGIYWYNFKAKKYLQTITYLPIIIPEIIIGVSMLILFVGIDIRLPVAAWLPSLDVDLASTIITLKLQLIDQFLHLKLGMPLSLFTIFIAHVTFSIPFVLFIIMARLEEFDYSIIEAAYDCGARELDVLIRIILPMTLPAILSGFLIAMTLSLDDFVITSFVMGAGSSTLPIYICNTIKRGAVPVLNSLSVLLILMSLLLAFVSRNLQKYIFK